MRLQIHPIPRNHLVFSSSLLYPAPNSTPRGEWPSSAHGTSPCGGGFGSWTLSSRPLAGCGRPQAPDVQRRCTSFLFCGDSCPLWFPGCWMMRRIAAAVGQAPTTRDAMMPRLPAAGRRDGDLRREIEAVQAPGTRAAETTVSLAPPTSPTLPDQLTRPRKTTVPRAAPPPTST